MLNDIKAYLDAGRRAARAMNDKDSARHQHEKGYFMTMLALETPEDRLLAREAFNKGYRDTRIIPSISYFR